MGSNQTSLEFVVELAESGFETKDLPKWRARLIDFFQGGDIYTEPQLSPSAHLPEDYTLDDFKELQRISSAILKDIIEARTAKIHLPELFKTSGIEYQFQPGKRGKTCYIFAHGATPDLFVYKLAELFRQESTSKILRCGAPASGEDDAKCGRLFYRSGRQKFCSTKCTNRDVMRKLRKLSDYRKSEREAAHERYTERIKRIDPNRKVKRRQLV